MWDRVGLPDLWKRWAWGAILARAAGPLRGENFLNEDEDKDRVCGWRDDFFESLKYESVAALNAAHSRDIRDEMRVLW